LLEGNQLVYRAGSGCAALWLGVRFAASLTVSSKDMDRREILRVENARTDTRIEGAICRQFGAESLLILPIYRDRLLAGVMEILFREPHAFQDGEVRVYRLLAGLIEEAMGRAAQAEQKLPTAMPAVGNTFEEAPTSRHYIREKRPILLLHSVGKSIFRRCGAGLTAAWESSAFRPFRRPRLLAEVKVQRATDIFANKPIRNLAWCAVVTALGLTFWMAHGGRGRDSWGSPGPTKSPAVSSFQPDVKPVHKTSKGQFEPIPVHEAKPAQLKNPRVRVPHNEIEYIGDDVTVRHFNYKPARQQTSGRVAHIGKDVTVRYFTPKPALSYESR
jgi:hypothetical protein